jgi:hypothetical protein
VELAPGRSAVRGSSMLDPSCVRLPAPWTRVNGRGTDRLRSGGGAWLHACLSSPRTMAIGTRTSS